jgi:hypothetical protein
MRITWINANIDMLNVFFIKLLDFIHKNENEFKLNTTEEMLFNLFCDFLYDNFIKNDYESKINFDLNFEYFNLKYCSDIVDLFIDLKEISYGYTNNIFNYKNKDSNNLIEFIYKNIELYEDFINEEDIQEEYIEDEYY